MSDSDTSPPKDESETLTTTMPQEKEEETTAAAMEQDKTPAEPPSLTEEPSSAAPEEEEDHDDEEGQQQHQEDPTPMNDVVVSNGDATPALSTASSSIGNYIPGSSTTGAVTTDRKHKLLMQARSNRLEWIQTVSLPYKKETPQQNLWSSDKRLALLGSSRVAVEAPTVTRVLNLLYGMEDNNNSGDIAERIQGLLEPLGSAHQEDVVSRAIPSEQDVLNAEIAKHGKDSKTGLVVVAYQDFISKLQLPECAMLVQGMRNFCRHATQQDDAKKLAVALEHYVQATTTLISSHSAWKGMGEENVESIRRSLESFLFGQVSAHIQNTLLVHTETKEADEEWTTRLESLQFVNAHHLELDCFMQDSGEDESTEEEAREHVKQLLKDPIEALLSVDSYHSPYEKLQRILHVYHGVNAALSEALNKSVDEKDDKVLPSADHVLPTLILVVLCAQPRHLVLNLSLIETYCPSVYLRGEAGYAFTNLYGAVQFLRDIDLDKQEGQPDSSLNMTPDEFREGLTKCRAAAQERLLETTRMTNQKDVTLVAAPKDEDDEDGDTYPNLPADISVTDIRTARLRGDDMSLDWALSYHDEARRVALNKSHLTEESSVPPVQQAAALSKSYSFLTTRAEDVKVSDLPLLLREYRQLVHTTEVLLAERTARLANERKKAVAKKRKKLQASAAAVDPELMM